MFFVVVVSHSTISKRKYFSSFRQSLQRNSWKFFQSKQARRQEERKGNHFSELIFVVFSLFFANDDDDNLDGHKLIDCKSTNRKNKTVRTFCGFALLYVYVNVM